MSKLKSVSAINIAYAALVEKYNYEAFMYVEYPHKSFWSQKFNEKNLRAGLIDLFMVNKNAPLLLYVHIPFCRRRCFYCTCATEVTNDYKKIMRCLDSIFLEIDLFHDFFKENSIVPNVTDIHIGGGSPTILQEKEFGRLIEKLQSIANMNHVSEFSIEIDPREVDVAKLKYYHRQGINRISLGVQDFDFDVQKAVNRVQPPELVEKLLTPEVRQCFKKGINFDLICGLPHQSRESIQRTFEKVVKMCPDRICFNYLHYSPKHAKHQERMIDGRGGRPTALPDLVAKKILFGEALDILLRNGYVRTGYDHFAKSTDETAKAMQNRTMQWNALGVTAGRYHDIIGIGPHSWSTVGNCYSQNVYELSAYEAVVKKSRFPVYRGFELNKDDVIRRDVIQALRNFFYLDFNDIEKKYGIDFKKYFREEMTQLTKFAKDGMIKLSDTEVTITELGQQFSNIICMSFDAFIKNKRSLL